MVCNPWLFQISMIGLYRCTPYPRNHSSRHGTSHLDDGWLQGKAYGNSPDVLDESWGKFERNPGRRSNHNPCVLCHGLISFVHAPFYILYTHHKAHNKCLHRISIIYMDIRAHVAGSWSTRNYISYCKYLCK